MALSISLDCNDLGAQERFWTAALDYEVVERADAHTALAPKQGRAGTRLYLNLVPEPKSVKNRMHVDWDVDDVEAEATRLEGLGAARVGIGTLPGLAWITLHDPEGNEFCVEQVMPAAGRPESS
jgi:predicted enzyme related to lactoylglutathione lyase